MRALPGVTLTILLAGPFLAGGVAGSAAEENTRSPVALPLRQLRCQLPRQLRSLSPRLRSRPILRLPRLPGLEAWAWNCCGVGETTCPGRCGPGRNRCRWSPCST